MYASIMAKKKRAGDRMAQSEDSLGIRRRKTLFGIDETKAADLKGLSSSEESSDDSNRDNNETFYSVDRILKYQAE